MLPPPSAAVGVIQALDFDRHDDQPSVAHAALGDHVVGDALDLDLPDASVDAVLLLGPLYHLVDRAERVQALRECARIVRAARPTASVDSVAGWGFKRTARYARALAAGRGWPYLALEDGFLRSVGLGEAGAPPISLVVDDLGIYYDARQPSRLEALLEAQGWEHSDLLARARSIIGRLVETGLSKTNAAPPLRPGLLEPTTRRRVLVIDQTAGDASIAGGLADAATFSRMLETARRDEPGARIVVRRHPAVEAGLKRGCLDPEALAGALPSQDIGLQRRQLVLDEARHQILEHPVLFGQFEIHSKPFPRRRHFRRCRDHCREGGRARHGRRRVTGV